MVLQNQNPGMGLANIVCFANSGEIEIDAVTTLGVSVKEGDRPIGQFGTGLKYSIAVLLREGHRVVIMSGLNRYSFFLKEKIIRGEKFQLIHIQENNELESRSLGFTTSYGKNWKLEHVYRELWSNMTDENGEVTAFRGWAAGPEIGSTKIIVYGEQFARIHEQRYENILLDPAKRKIAESSVFEVYHGISSVVYYRGIAALKLSIPSMYTYNYISDQPLTEDRTLEGGSYMLAYYIELWLRSNAAQEEVYATLLASKEAFLEGGLSYSMLGGHNENWLAAVKQALQESPSKCNVTAAEVFMQKTALQKFEFKEKELSGAEQELLERTLAQIARWGYDYASRGYAVQVVEDCGDNILARVNGQGCVVLYKCLADTELLQHALVEEFIHLKFNVNDNSRAMQNVLFNEIIRHAVRAEDAEAQLRSQLSTLSGLAPEVEADEIPF